MPISFKTPKPTGSKTGLPRFQRPPATFTVGGKVHLLLTREVADRWRFASPDGAIAYLRQRGVRSIRRGRVLLWSAAEVERVFSAEENMP